MQIYEFFWVKRLCMAAMYSNQKQQKPLSGLLFASAKNKRVALA